MVARFAAVCQCQCSQADFFFLVCFVPISPYPHSLIYIYASLYPRRCSFCTIFLPFRLVLFSRWQIFLHFTLVLIPTMSNKQCAPCPSTIPNILVHKHMWSTAETTKMRKEKKNPKRWIQMYSKKRTKRNKNEKKQKSEHRRTYRGEHWMHECDCNVWMKRWNSLGAAARIWNEMVNFHLNINK